MSTRGTLKRVLDAIAEDLYERAVIDLSELIDGRFGAPSRREWPY